MVHVHVFADCAWLVKHLIMYENAGSGRCTYLQLVECRPSEDNLVVYYEWFGIKSTCKCNALKTANEAV